MKNKTLGQQRILNDIDSIKAAGPVTCLSLTFENDEARRAYFTDELRKRLQELKKIEGYPIGEDEDILALSDPPYYTACPNPWIPDFITQWDNEKRELYGDNEDEYHREPFAADVSEGKNDPIYNAHGYHTKVPHKAIMRYILHYTEPGDIVFDGFCGTGMTGVAAKMCGDRDVVMSLGYQVKPDGAILQEETDENGKKFWKKCSNIGERRTVLNDLSPIATFIAHNYNDVLDIEDFTHAAQSILTNLEANLGWMYKTSHEHGETCRIDFVVWSELFTCPYCNIEINFLDEALDAESKQVRSEFPCPGCDAILNKRRMERVFETTIDLATGNLRKHIKYKPTEIHYRFLGQKYSKVPDQDDLNLLQEISKRPCPLNIPTNEFPTSKMYHGSRIKPKGFTHAHHFFLQRPLEALAFLWNQASNYRCSRTSQALLFFVEQAVTSMNIQNRYGPKKYSQSNGMLPLVYYIPSQIAEVSPWYVLNGKLNRLIEVFRRLSSTNGSIISTGDTSSLNLIDDSIDYIFTDPPFGENIFYADLNLIVESWHKVFTSPVKEAVVDKFKKKELHDYQVLMLSCFKQYYAALKPKHWITIEFSNSAAAVWNVIQLTLQGAGFIVANVSVLDKQQGSFRAVTSTTAVKQDLVISAYKPANEMKDEINRTQNSEESVWAFIRAHLGQLPIFVGKEAASELVVERTPRVLFDRMLSYYVQNGFNVPISSVEFQVGIALRFPMRNGMAFLETQVAEYDKKRMLAQEFTEMTLFVSDENSAIEWLRQQLLKKPQTRQDIHPDYMKQIQHISKFEKLPELDLLLEQSFLQYDGTGPVPSRIHAYLSTNFKDLRELDKEDAALRKKAKDRWYVPDPNKQADLENLRDKSLLREFGVYVEEINRSKKKLKQFRLEAIRAGFKKAWGEKDYKTIVDIGSKIPETVLQEDDKLLMYYDNAQIRLEM